MTLSRSKIMDESIVKKLVFIHERLEDLVCELEKRGIEVGVDLWTLIFMLYDMDQVRFMELSRDRESTNMEGVLQC